MRPRVLFGFGLLLGDPARTHYLSGRTEPRSKDDRCLNHSRSPQEARRAKGPTGINKNPRRSYRAV
ncbi:MAG: hypothetical protein E5W56_08280 [Mesorhizobium sp.]|nr:hypothetical protein EN874_021185 [Mesorhizobium sp. M1D.F.Ca.ET.231.01.1.1]TGP30375.1 hypothetical protein EN877_19565 [Mesorhizobium sp. M1D.F.Ca.ET.234.01.1.1]TGS44451.1 hypothetical protein EN827_19560 [Mesorhizobium sp. M1D.F.Ca.ET.184.01.1.1]TGS60491.1 hypothetical protein EN826_019560 [Mesorhizobium sp. M1D.F.Ca.ET.183.01.1.1]TIT77067.1 MAG: hypothetical protein E5W57_16590 [Mesorhizobium sp.]